MFAIDEHIKNNPALLNVRDLLSGYPALNIDHKDYNINVTANYGHLLERDALISEFSRFDGGGKPAHLYFHIPICSYICHFCNYVKRLPSKNRPLSETMDQWVDLLIDEASRHQLNAPWIRTAMIESVYLGGGTAALMNSDQLARLMKYVRESYNLSKNCEISLEGNPDNFISDLSSRAIEQGFNRFSVGVQSLQDEVLRFTGRGHDALMSRTAIESLLKTNKPFNADFMFGLPYQTPDTVEHDINTLIEMGVPTITIYRLRNSDRASMGIGNRSAWNNEKQ